MGNSKIYKHCSNQILKFGSDIFKPIITDGVKAISKEVKNRLFYVVEITGILSSHNSVVYKYFKHFPQFVSTDSCSAKNTYKINYFTQNGLSNKGQLTDFCFYKGVCIYLSLLKNDYTEQKLSVIRTKRNIAILKDFIKHIIDENIANYNPTVFTCNNSSGAPFKIKDVSDINKSIYDICIPEIQRKTIIDNLKSFVNKKDWYIKHDIPYHFGILLSGPPGTGKTSIAQAIAKYLKADLLLLSGDHIINIPKINDVRNNAFSHLKIILVEDIDYGFFSEDVVKNENNNNGKIGGMATILNSIDGIEAADNIIYIFTTNHIEKLNPALIRPGRIDLKLEIGYLNIEAFKQFLKSYYNDSTLPENFKIKDGLTCAELQTKVMSGMSREEIINHVKD